MLKLGDIVFGITADASGLDKAMTKMAALGNRLDEISKKDGEAARKRAASLMAQEKALTASMMKLKDNKFKMALAGAPDELLKRADEAVIQLQKRFSTLRGPLDPVQFQRAMTEYKVAMQQIGQEFELFKKKSQDASRAASQGMSEAEKRALKLERTMGTLARQVESANSKLSRIGGSQAAAGIEANNKAFERYRKVAESTESSVLDLTKAENELRASLQATAAAANSSGLSRTQREAENVKDALLNARIQLERFKNAASKKGASAETIGIADNAFADMEMAFNRFGMQSTQGREAARTFKAAINNAFQDNGQEQRINRWTLAMRNLNSAVTLVVGPLSGVGSRVSALTSTFMRADVAAGVLVTGLVAMTAATAALGVMSVKTELEMGRLVARFEALERIGGGQVATTFSELAALADRAGTRFVTTAEGFSRLEAAAAGTALEGARIRDIFDDISIGAARFQLDNDQLAGTLKALEQMLSKGTVQAEELRGQLGDRLPGAFQIASRAMGVTTKELNKMLKNGEVIAEDFLPKFAAEFARSFGTDGKVETLQADLNRLSNAFLKLRVNFNETFGVSEGFQKMVQGLTGVLNTLADNLDMVAASAAGLTTAIGIGLAGAIVAVKWSAITGALSTLGALIVSSARAAWALAASFYGAAAATNTLAVASARLDAVLTRTPWGLVAKVAAVAIATVAGGVLAFNQTKNAMSDSARAARAYEERMDGLVEKYQRLREIMPDATATELGFAINADTTGIQSLQKDIEKTQADITRSEELIAQWQEQIMQLQGSMNALNAEAVTQAIGGTNSAIEKQVKLLELQRERLVAAEAEMASLTQAERDRQAVIQKTGSLLTKSAQREIEILNQQAGALYASEAAFNSFNAQVQRSDDIFGMIKDSGEALGLTESQMRAVADAFAGIKNSTEPKIMEEFKRQSADTKNELKSIPEQLDRIWEGLKKLKDTGDRSVFGEIGAMLKEAAHNADPLVQKLKQLFPEVKKVDDALRNMQAANRANIMRDMAKDIARAQQEFDLIGQSDLLGKLASAQFSAEDAAKSYEKSLSQQGMSAAKAKEESKKLYDVLLLLGEARIRFDASKEIEQFTYDLMQLQKQTESALRSDFALQEFDRLAYVDDQVRRLALTFKDLYETEEEANAATAAWAKALRENADALYERQMAQTRFDSELEIQRMYDLANATLQGAVAVETLNKQFEAYDAVKSFSDSLKGLPADEYRERLLAFASAFDVTENIKRSTSGLREWSDGLRDYGMGALDAFTEAFATMIAEFDISAASLGQAAEALARDLTMTWLNLSLTNPLKNALFGTDMVTMAGQGATQLFGGALGNFGIGALGTPAQGMDNATNAAQQQLAQSMSALDLATSSAATTLGTDLVTSSANAAMQAGTAAIASSTEAASTATVSSALMAMQIAVTSATTALAQLALTAQLASSAQAGDAAASFIPGVKFAAKGAVLGGPTYFPNFNTVGGEAGPEGLLPLSRMADGRLGVAMQGGGGGGSETYNTYQFGDIIVQNGDPRKVKKSVTQALQQAERGRRTVQNNVRS